MARTAPTVSGVPTTIRVSFGWVDAEGDRRSDSLLIPASADDSQIEALAAPLAANSNANLYRIHVTQQYEAVPDPSSAVAAVHQSVHQNIVFFEKNQEANTRRVYLPSPIAGLFLVESDTPDITNAGITDIFTALDAILGGTYSPVSVRFSERREINNAVLY